MAYSDRVRETRQFQTRAIFPFCVFFEGGEVSAWEGKIEGKKAHYVCAAAFFLSFPSFFLRPGPFFLLTVDVPPPFLPPPPDARTHVGAQALPWEGGKKGRLSLCLLFPFRPKRERPRGL